MSIACIITRHVPPQTWTVWAKIPWDEPGFSARMLQNHLSQEHDWASRTQRSIEAHVAHIHSMVPEGARILDLGCGPGLYTEKLSRLGHACTGVDFSPASIAYARQHQGARQTQYILNNIMHFRPDDVFDAILLLFGELNAFSRDEALALLTIAAKSLRPGGLVFAEVHTEEAIRAIGQQPSRWQSLTAGLFSDQPHLLLEEHFWNEAFAAAMTRYYTVDAATSQCTEYAALLQAYTDRQYAELFTKAGLRVMRQIPAETWPTGDDFSGKLHCFVCGP